MLQKGEGAAAAATSFVIVARHPADHAQRKPLIAGRPDSSGEFDRRASRCAWRGQAGEGHPVRRDDWSRRAPLTRPQLRAPPPGGRRRGRGLRWESRARGPLMLSCRPPQRPGRPPRTWPLARRRTRRPGGVVQARSPSRATGGARPRRRPRTLVMSYPSWSTLRTSWHADLSEFARPARQVARLVASSRDRVRNHRRHAERAGGGFATAVDVLAASWNGRNVTQGRWRRDVAIIVRQWLIECRTVPESGGPPQDAAGPRAPSVYAAVVEKALGR